MAAFHSIIYGRFWVITKVTLARICVELSKKQGCSWSISPTFSPSCPFPSFFDDPYPTGLASAFRLSEPLNLIALNTVPQAALLIQFSNRC